MAGKASKKFDLGELTRALSDVPEAVPKSGTLCMIPLDDLLPNPKNPYPLLDEDAMLKLMDSIEDAGLLEPVSAYPMDGGKYMLVSGHNRREAYRRLRAERDDGTHGEQQERSDGSFPCRTAQFFRVDAQFFACQRFEGRVFVGQQLVGHALCFFFTDAAGLIDQRQLLDFFLRRLLDLFLLRGDLIVVQLP